MARARSRAARAVGSSLSSCRVRPRLVRWFEDWLRAEREANSLRIWQPLIVPGLLQTADYARALCRAGTLSSGEEEVEQQVAARMAREAAPPPWQRRVPGELAHRVTLARRRYRDEFGCLRRRTMRRAERVDMGAEYVRRTAASSAALLSDIRESLAELGTTGPPVLTKQDALRLLPGQ